MNSVSERLPKQQRECVAAEYSGRHGRCIPAVGTNIANIQSKRYVKHTKGAKHKIPVKNYSPFDAECGMRPSETVPFIPFYPIINYQQKNKTSGEEGYITLSCLYLSSTMLSYLSSICRLPFVRNVRRRLPVKNTTLFFPPSRGKKRSLPAGTAQWGSTFTLHLYIQSCPGHTLFPGSCFRSTKCTSIYNQLIKYSTKTKTIFL